MRGWVAALLLFLCMGGVIGLVLWNKTKESPSPSPISPSGPGPPSRNYCEFKATGDNKDNFTISSSENIALFPENDNSKFTYPNNKGAILNCKTNASGLTAYAPSGPTHLGYKIDNMNNNTNTTLLPADGKTTKNNNTCSWDPNSNICNVAICNLDEIPNFDISYKDKGVKQLLTEAELNDFKSRVSCKNGEKVGKCSPAPSSSGGNCGDPKKQNNKINCLGTCSDTSKLTKEECENTPNATWTYDPEKENPQCQYEILNQPILNRASIPTQGDYYKMCEKAGDNVPIDEYFTSCSGNCYPDPIAKNRDNIHEIPLSWTNHCMFTNDDLTKPFTTSSPNDSDCNTGYFTGKVYHNICNGKTSDCSSIQGKIESIIHSPGPSPSPIPPPCMGGGDTFNTYNSCEPVSCDEHFSGDPSKGYEFTSCGTGKIEKNTGSSPSPSISLPPASYCDPKSPSPGIVNYMKSKVHNDCCEEITCEMYSCPSNLYNPIANGDSNPEKTKCHGSVCNQSECCVLKTCSEYMGDNGSESDKKICNSDYKRDTDKNSYYILPTCCNGMLQVSVTFQNGVSIKSIVSEIEIGEQNSTITNVYPSLILKKLLRNFSNYDTNTINYSQLKNADNLSFINNLTTFILPPKPDIVYMDNLEKKGETKQKTELSKMKDKSVNFYILINQHDNTEGVTRFNIQRAWDNINKIIKDETYDTKKIDTIDVVINDCRQGSNGACEVAPGDNRILGDKNSHCCVENTCGNLPPETQKGIEQRCDKDKHFEQDKVLSSPTPGSNLKEECCVENNITANIPPLPSDMSKTVDAVYGQSYIKRKQNSPSSQSMELPPKINFKWDTYSNKWLVDPSNTNYNTELQKNYECVYSEPVPAGSPTKKPVFSVDPKSPQYYKLEGCEDTKNIFCRIPTSDTDVHRSIAGRIEIPVTDEKYDSKIYNLTETVEDARGSYISMYQTFEIQKGNPPLNPNYGGITCQQDQAGIATIEPCDEPYGYIKFSGCNTYLNDNDGEYQFYESEYTQKDCIYFNDSKCLENQNICEYDTTTNKCKPRPFPISRGGDMGNSCSANLEASDTFSDALWLKEGFTNYDYTGSIGKGNNGNRGYSSRIINDDSSPVPSTREVSRRTNLCGYNFQSPTPTPTSTPSNQLSSLEASPPSKQIQPDSMDYYHSRVLDSTWLCEDKSCRAGESVNIKIPQGGKHIKEFTSFFDGDPLVYTWQPTNEGDTSGNWSGKNFYSESILRNDGNNLILDDYRALQGEITDSQSSDTRLNDPMTDGVKDRIDNFTKIQNRYSHLISSPSPLPSPSPGSQQNDDYNDLSYNASEMEYVHNNIKYHNNYATMCGDNKFLRFFDYDTMSEITSKGQEASQMSLIKNYQKCTPCRYQRDQLVENDTKYSDFYNREYNKLSSVEQKYINDHNFPKSDGSELGHVFLSEATQNKDYNIHNKTNLSADTHDMTNCSVSPDSSSNKEINIDEYSTHFVPWWRDTAATDLKVNKFSTVSELSSPTTIPTCDLHKDRCEYKTNQSQCLNASSSFAWNDTPTTVNASMCEWSDGKCTTNDSWVSDQGMCGHPCLSRMDARPRECKFSDDCEIRDRYNFNILENTNSGLTMYCDSDGRNPILYGEKGKDNIEEGQTTISTNNPICKPGYILYDIGMSGETGGNTPSSSQTPSPNSKTAYKCLKCDELNKYEGGQSFSYLNASDQNMIQLYDKWINGHKKGVGDPKIRKDRVNQYNLKGDWKEINGKCEKSPMCTSVLWPSPATAISAKYDPKGISKWNTSVDARVIYTQDPIVANQQVKQDFKNQYTACVNQNDVDLPTFNVEGENTEIWNNSSCTTVFSEMDKLLGLTTKSGKTGYEDKTLLDKGLILECDPCPPGSSCVNPWKYKNMDISVAINVGGIRPYKGGNYPSYDWKNTNSITRMNDTCPNNNNNWFWDGKDPHRYYCSPPVGKGQECYGTNDACDGLSCLSDNRCHGFTEEGDKCSDKYDCGLIENVDTDPDGGGDIYYSLPKCDTSFWHGDWSQKVCLSP